MNNNKTKGRDFKEVKDYKKKGKKKYWQAIAFARVKDFFWELIMLIYGNLTYLNNWKISLDKIIKLTFRFLTGCWFL